MLEINKDGCHGDLKSFLNKPNNKKELILKTIMNYLKLIQVKIILILIILRFN